MADGLASVSRAAPGHYLVPNVEDCCNSPFFACRTSLIQSRSLTMTQRCRSRWNSFRSYRHPNCPAASGKAVTYDAKGPEVMARLPPFLAAQLSITITQSGAMDDDMLQHIHHDVMKGLSIQAACDGAVTFLRRNHNHAELDYISFWTYLQQPGTQTLLDGPTPCGAPPPFWDFGSAGHSKPYISCSRYGAGV